MNTIEQNNQILINKEIAMGGKIVLRAVQHKFESGGKVVSPVTVLATAPNDCMSKFFIPTSAESIKSNIKVDSSTHIWGL